MGSFNSASYGSDLWTLCCLVLYIVGHSLVFPGIPKGLEQVVLRACGGGGGARNTILLQEFMVYKV